MAVIIKSDPAARAKPCLRCGYSLRKIVESRNCPECGLSIWISLSGSNALDQSNPDWLRRLSVATAIMSVAQTPAAICLVLLAATDEMLSSLFFLFLGLHFTAYHAGLLLLLANEGRVPDTSRSLRRFGTVLSCIGILLGIWMLFLATANELTLIRWGNFVFNCGAGGGVISALITWVWLKRLARRMSHHSRMMLRLCGYLTVATLLPVAGRLVNDDFFLMAWLSWAVQRLPWVYFPFVAVLLLWFSRSFSQAARAANHHWASPNPL